MATASRHSDCEICFEEYNEKEKCPKFLSCFHSYCVTCLKNLEALGKISCPSCRQETNVDGPDGVLSLQTNFYILTGGGGKTADKPEVAPPSKLQWCTACTKIANKDCDQKNHERCDLDSEEGAMMAETHFKLHLMNCKKVWTEALKKRQEIEGTFDTILSSLRALEEQVLDRRNENEKQIKRVQNSLENVSTLFTTPVSNQRSEKELKSLLDKCHSLLSESNKDDKVASKELGKFGLIRESVASVQIVGGQNSAPSLTASLLQNVKLNFPSTGASEQENHLLTAFSYLVLTASSSVDKSAPPTVAGASTANTNKAKQDKIKKPNGDNKLTKPLNPSKPESKLMDKKGQNHPHNPADKNKPHIYAKNKKVESSFVVVKPDEQVPTQGTSSWLATGLNIVEQIVNQLDAANQHPPKKNQPTVDPSPVTVSPPSFYGPPINLQNKKCFMTFAVNGKTYGNVTINLRPDVAPIMCQKFAQMCMGTHGPSYHGTIIYKAFAKAVIMGGRVSGTEELYMADRSPLKKVRGAVFLRLKRDYTKTQCSIVSTEFCIQLSDDNKGEMHHRESSVFGYISDGLAVCDAISHMDAQKQHIAVSTAGLVAS